MGQQSLELVHLWATPLPLAAAEQAAALIPAGITHSLNLCPLQSSCLCRQRPQVGTGVHREAGLNIAAWQQSASFAASKTTGWTNIIAGTFGGILASFNLDHVCLSSKMFKMVLYVEKHPCKFYTKRTSAKSNIIGPWAGHNATNLLRKKKHCDKELKAKFHKSKSDRTGGAWKTLLLGFFLEMLGRWMLWGCLGWHIAWTPGTAPLDWGTGGSHSPACLVRSIRGPGEEGPSDSQTSVQVVELWASSTHSAGSWRAHGESLGESCEGCFRSVGYQTPLSEPFAPCTTGARGWSALPA